MFPLYDKSRPNLKTPYVTLTLILTNIGVFVVSVASGDFEGAVAKFGATPSVVMQGKELITLITSLFLHGGIVHLLPNMWFLWLFGDNVEDHFGSVRFLLFYLLTGVLATLAHVFATVFIGAGSDAIIPTIGASGAVSGILGAYVVLFPHNRIKAGMIMFFRFYTFYVPAYAYMFVWFLYQFMYIGTPTSIAYMAHIGGFAAGMILVGVFGKRRN